MIQRRQTLFLFELVFLAIALLFIPSQHVSAADIYLVPVNEPGLESSSGHLAAVALNFAGLILAFATIFLYRKLRMQVILSYVLTFVWVILTLMILFCPFVLGRDMNSGIEPNYFAAVIGLFGIVAGILAARLIKKDIELLKSADRIR
jgi:hypothetical protein